MQKEKHSSSWLGNSVRWFVVHDHVNIHILRSLLWDLCNNDQAQMSFICHIHNYTEYNQQWNVFSAFNPSKCAHTLGPVGSRRCGARGAVEGTVPCSRVSPQSWTIPAGAEIRNPQPRVTSPTLYPLEPRLPPPPHTHIHTSVWKCLVRIE